MWWSKRIGRLADATVSVMPTSFLIGRDGVVLNRHEGWRGARSKKQLEQELEEIFSNDEE